MARQYRTYEVLLSDQYAGNGTNFLTGENELAHFLGFPVGANGSWCFDVPSAANEGLPQTMQGAVSAEQLLRQQCCGFTAIFPLWTPEMYEYHGRDISLRALRGYLLPTAVLIEQDGDPAAFVGIQCKVRMALMNMHVGVAGSTGFGNVSFSGGAGAALSTIQRRSENINIFSFEDFGRRRMWWYRDWYIPANQNSFTYWAPGGQAQPLPGPGTPFFEPKLAPLNGGIAVKLGRRAGALMRITKDNWPVLVVGVVANVFEQNALTDLQPGTNVRTLKPTTNLAIGLNGDLRAFLTR